MSLDLFARTLPASRAAGTLLAAAAAVTTIVLFGPQILRIVAHATPHGPDVALFMAQPVVIKVHILAAIAGVGLGATILSLRKGNGLHRALGWTWVLLMGAAAASSLFIVGLNGDYWSLIHLLSGWTLLTLPFAVGAARKRDVTVHRRAMTSLFWGAAIVAGTFAFLPGRLMWDLFMG